MIDAGFPSGLAALILIQAIVTGILWGLVHLADERKDRFDAFMYRLGAWVATAFLALQIGRTLVYYAANL